MLAIRKTPLQLVRIVAHWSRRRDVLPAAASGSACPRGQLRQRLWQQQRLPRVHRREPSSPVALLHSLPAPAMIEPAA